GWKRVEHVTGERKRLRCAFASRCHHDLGSGEIIGGNSLVDLVTANLPAPANDSARRIVHPRASAANLDFLSARKPVTTFDQCVLEHDRYVLELLIDQRGASEAESHAHDVARFTIDVNG